MDVRTSKASRSSRSPAETKNYPRYWNLVLQSTMVSVRETLAPLIGNWDGEQAKPIKNETLERVESFLKLLAQRFYKRYKKRLPPPNIVPGTNGEIEVLWKLASFQLSVDIPEDQTAPVVYYADNYKGNRLKGTVTYQKASQIFFACLEFFK